MFGMCWGCLLTTDHMWGSRDDLGIISFLSLWATGIRLQMSNISQAPWDKDTLPKESPVPFPLAISL